MKPAAIRDIYLIRHGETDYNKQGIIQGRNINSPLNETGRRQAMAFFKHFAHIPFDAIFASTLLRTLQTLEPFARKGYSILQFEELDEISWGVHEGRLSDHDTRNEFYRITQRWKNGILNEKIDGGESPIELQQRQLNFIKNILPLYKGNILICSHGRAIRSLLCTMLNISLSEMDNFPHSNLSLYHLQQNQHGFTIVKFNYTDHLKCLDV